MNMKPELSWGIIAVVIALFLALFFSIEAGIYVLLFALVANWVWKSPEESFLLLIIIAPLLPLLKATQTLGNLTLIKDVIIITLFLKTFFVPLIEQRLPYRKNLLFAPIVALVLWSLFEVLQGGSTLAILRFREIVLYILMYFGVLYLSHTKKIMRTRAIVFGTTVVIVMLLGIFQFWFAPDSTVLRFDPARMIWIPRMASTFGHPTVFAEYLITGMMLILGILLARTKISQLVKYKLYGVLLVSVILLYFTYTRAGWIGCAGGVVALFIAWMFSGKTYRVNMKSIAVIVIALIVVFVGALRFTPVGTFLQTAIDPTYASNADRISFVVQLISQTSNADALVGKGLGNVITEARKGGDVSAVDIASGDSRTVQLSKDSTLVDNQYLKTFMEMGVVGIVFTFWLFWRFFLAAQKATPALRLAGIGFLVAFMIQALFVDIWDVFPTNGIFWTLAALISQSKIGKGA
jgi:O-antigen ligase